MGDARRSEQRWEPGPVVAWTESDGPGRLPPVPSRRLGVAAAIAAGIACWGFMTADDVCPEHSLLIQFVGSIALALTVVGIVAAIRSSVAAAPLILAASVFGVSIGVVDALHNVTASRILAIGFAVAGVIAAMSAVMSVRLRHWERSTLAAAERPLDPELFRGAADNQPAAQPARPERTPAERP